MTDTSVKQHLRVSGGTWSALLFENRAIGLAPALSWTFEVQLAGDAEPVGDPPLESVTVDWVPVDASSWTALAPATVECAEFGEPVEASVFSWSHHRFDTVRLELLRQEGTTLWARIALSGDVDDLGVESLTLEAPLAFDGLRVVTEDVNDLESARTALSSVIDVSSLTGVREADHYAFLHTGRTTAGGNDAG